MKKYLISLKSKLIKNNSILSNIANILELELVNHDLRVIPTQRGFNRYSMDGKNMVFFYPVNDGFPTCTFEFYEGSKMVLSNKKVYSEITNLDEIILQMVRLYDKSLDNGIVLDPYYFMLRLEDEIEINYKGKATLLITDKAIRNQKLNNKNFDEANKYFINKFLDRFIGWNFGVSVNRNEILKSELELLNKKVIDMGIREYAGPGFQVYGVEDEAKDGLQHYYLPKERSNVKKKK